MDGGFAGVFFTGGCWQREVCLQGRLKNGKTYIAKLATHIGRLDGSKRAMPANDD